MNTLAPRFVLLAAIDDSPAADLVLAQAARMARATPGAEIHVLHVPDRFTHAPVTPRTFDLEEGRRFVDAKARRLQSDAGVRVIGHLLERDPVRAILQCAASIDADLVIVGPHHDRLSRALLGSVADKVANRA